MPFQRRLIWAAAAWTAFLFSLDIPCSAAVLPKSVKSMSAVNTVYHIYVKGIT